MISKVFTIYDSKAEIYLPPFNSSTKGSALRMFTESANDPKSNICKYAEDFTLFEIGEYDDQKGIVHMYPAHVSLGTALEFRKSKEQDAVAEKVSQMTKNWRTDIA